MAHTHARAALLSIGDELCLGQTLDTNGRWLAQRLRDAGVSPVEHVTVPDDLDRHVAALRRLAGEVDLIVSSGGLGPTDDDLTREALARASGEPLVEDASALAQVETFFAARARAMPPINRVQALRPASAQCLANPEGTAPGLWGRLGRCDVACLPGPPGEMKPMFDAQILPRLRPPTSRTVLTRALHCFGIGESVLATRLGTLMRRDAPEGVIVGTTASAGVVSVRLRVEGELSTAEAAGRIARVEAMVRERAGGYLFGVDDESLATAVIDRLRARGQRLGLVESCTGGLLAAMVSGVPGASDVLWGGLVTYANRAKELLAGVDAATIAAHGAVSEPVAAALARGGLSRLDTDHTLAITGIAGPGGATPAKPVGSVFIARAQRDAPHVEVRRFAFTGDRQNVREWAARTALAMLRLHLDGLSNLTLLREDAITPRA